MSLELATLFSSIHQLEVHDTWQPSALCAHLQGAGLCVHTSRDMGSCRVGSQHSRTGVLKLCSSGYVGSQLHGYLQLSLALGNLP